MLGIDTIYGFLDYIYKKHEELKNNEINLIYDGLITHMITKAFAALTEQRMEKEEESDPVQRKVFHVMIECLQNISKHAEESLQGTPSSLKKGIIMVSKGVDRYSVVTGNAIENANVAELEETLKNLNTLDKDGLTKLYKTQLKNNVLSDKGGAGLGFIDIARKTGEKLDFEFVPMNDKYSYFILITTVLRVSNM